MTDEDKTQGFDTHDADDVQRVTDKEDYRSLLRISPGNEAKHCETVQDCRDKIEAELDRENPRDWVIGIFNERAEELRNADG
jgi:hypothetical protein